jgi:hypothetical protein
VTIVYWDEFDFELLERELRDGVGGPDGEKMLWAFEQAVAVARVDPALLDYMLAAVVCLLAHSSDRTPRAVLDAFSRRSVSDDEWRDRYADLFPSAL